jgi:O-antigen ligase
MSAAQTSKTPRIAAPEVQTLLAAACILALIQVAGFPVAAAAAAGGATFLIGLRSTSSTIAILILTVPIQDVGAIDVGPLALTWTKIIVLAAVAAWTSRILAMDRPAWIDSVGVGLVAHLLALMASVVNAGDLRSWAEEVYRWTIPLVVYLMVLSARGEPLMFIRVVAATAIAVLGTCLIGVWQSFTGAGPASFEARGLTRAFAFFGEPNPLAGYLEMTVPLLAAVSIYWLKNRQATRTGATVGWLCVSGTLIGSATLLLTQSKGGILGFSAGMAVVAYAAGRRLRIATIAVAAAGIVSIGVGLIVAPSLIGSPSAALGAGSERQVTAERFSVQERLAHWRAGIAMAQTHPVLGIGAGNFNDRYREFTKVWRFRIPRGHAHNAYIQAAAQAGVIGLATYCVLLGLVGHRLWKGLTTVNEAFNRSIIVGAFGVTIAIIVHGFFDYLHVLSLGIQLSVVWAIASIASIKPDAIRPNAGHLTIRQRPHAA